MAIEYVDPKLLKPHPRNIAIYGDEAVEHLKEKVASSKWIKALVVTPANVIISGHSRWRVAMELNITKVPIERRVFTNELEELEALLLENVSRVKTPVQMVHEGEAWEYIEKKKAEITQFTQGDHGKEGGNKKQKSKIEQLENNISNQESTLEELVPQGLTPDTSTNTSQTPSTQTAKKKKPRASQTRDKVAAQVGFGSGKTYENAKKAVDAAKELEQKGKVEEANVLRQVLNKPGNIKAAAQVASLSEDKQTAILGAIATGQAKDIKEAKAVVKKEELAEQAKTVVLPDTIQLLHGDFRILGKEITDKSVDLIFTDPPYHDEHLSLWSDLSAFASRVLKPGGILLSYSGQLFLPQVLSDLNQHLEYCWLLGVAHSGGHIQIWKHHLWNDWKPIVMFSNGKMTPDNHEWFDDLYRGNKGDKEVHEWSQGEGEASYFIEKLTKPGQLVLDPMCGSGTILHAAHKLKRRTCGLEVDEARYNVALGSMKDLQEVTI